MTASATADGKEVMGTLSPVIFDGLLSVINLFFVGPQTIMVLKNRTHQGV
jgi:hypothetical protein